MASKKVPFPTYRPIPARWRAFYWVKVLQPSQPNRVMLSLSVYLTTLFPDRLSSLSSKQYLKLTTALLESGKGRVWPQKIVHDRSPAGIAPTTSWSPIGCIIRLSNQGWPKCRARSYSRGLFKEYLVIILGCFSYFTIKTSCGHTY